MRAIVLIATPVIFLDAIIVYFNISPTITAVTLSVIFSSVLSYFLINIYNQKTWIIPGTIGFTLPVIGFILLGIWWHAAFS
jgi:hypothetical protein